MAYIDAVCEQNTAATNGNIYAIAMNVTAKDYALHKLTDIGPTPTERPPLPPVTYI